MVPPPVIALEDVEVRRGSSFRLLVRHLAVGAGEAVAIVGSSGSGKSTCLDVIAAILRPAGAGRFEIRPGDGEAAIPVARLWDAGDQRSLRELRGRMHTQLFEDVRAVCLHGLVADLELAGDLLVRDAARHQHRHFVFAWRQLFDELASLGLRRVVFSSSASVYAAVPGFEVTEESPLAPASPYARTKAMTEQAVVDSPST